MIASGTEAEVLVIGLIGERGRELYDFLEHTLGAEGRERRARDGAQTGDGGRRDYRLIAHVQAHGRVMITQVIARHAEQVGAVADARLGLVGEHSDQVMRDILGMTDEEMVEVLAAGAVV